MRANTITFGVFVAMLLALSTATFAGTDQGTSSSGTTNSAPSQQSGQAACTPEHKAAGHC